jgi:hypothetical protein
VVRCNRHPPPLAHTPETHKWHACIHVQPHPDPIRPHSLLLAPKGAGVLACPNTLPVLDAPKAGVLDAPKPNPVGVVDAPGAPNPVAAAAGAGAESLFFTPEA